MNNPKINHKLDSSKIETTKQSLHHQMSMTKHHCK